MRQIACSLLWTLGVGCALLVSAAPAQARPAHKRALGDYLGSFQAAKLNDCRTCHLPDPPDKKKAAPESDKPHNAFGARLKDVRSQLRRAGKPAGIVARLRAIADEDSDKDGVPNLIELLTGHFPGEADDTPTPARAAEGRQIVSTFLKSKTGYAWTPFEKVQRPEVPSVKNAARIRNPIDAFIAHEHERLGLKPRPEAPKHVLLRRVYLDLIGLPPTPEELHAFLKDDSKDAYEKVVDRLLNDPRHGERWGRHWMDVWRYSDWAGWSGGKQIRDSQPHIWRWRDWIVESLNANKGYDRMIVEMLAADEIAPTDPKALRATGYLVRNYKMLSREKWLQDTVEHTSQAFLGLTLRCARCHDHMYDPVTQEDYYRFRAIFEPHHVRTDRVPGETDTKKAGLVRAYDKSLGAPTYLFVRGDDRFPDKSKTIPPGVPELLGGEFKVEPVKLPKYVSVPGKRPFVIADLQKESQHAVEQARAKLRQSPGETAEQALKVAEARHKTLTLVLRAEQLEDAGKKGGEEWKKAATAALAAQRELAVAESETKLIAARQELQKAADKAKAGVRKKVDAAEKTLAAAEAELKKPATTAYKPRPIQKYPDTSTGRRLALARWIVHRDNPLTARVAVNHVWLRHFGSALVPRTFDFGRNGQPPSHPALLDWLAVEFMESGWKMKHLHRLIATSAAYRMASTPDADNARIDPDNKYLWRMNSRRAEAEVVRDSIFYVAGKLDLTMGGPDIDHKLGLTVPRRSLYFRHAAEKQMEFLKLFDAASVTECYRRNESIVPQQALALANSDLTRRHGRILARKLAEKVGLDPAKFTAAAFEHVLSRPATEAEIAECVSFLKEQSQRYAANAKPQAAADPALRACENLVHVLMNHHDFVTIR